MPNKDRLLLLLKMLHKQTDEDTWLSTVEIRKALEAENVACSVRTLRTDIRALKDSGYEIAVEEKRTGRQGMPGWIGNGPSRNCRSLLTRFPQPSSFPWPTARN